MTQTEYLCKLLKIQYRIKVLTARDSVTNKNLINKLRRQERQMLNEQ